MEETKKYVAVHEEQFDVMRVVPSRPMTEEERKLLDALTRDWPDEVLASDDE